jgi:hypothetical protein
MRRLIVGDRVTFDYIAKHRVELLAELNRRQRVMRDYVRGVASGRTTGLYLFGPPGTGKTHTVQGVLENEVSEVYCYQPGHLTPGGLFELIAGRQEDVIVLDDLSVIFKSDVALQILLSALGKPDRSGGGRMVKYKRKDREQRVCFRGGIICISNKELHDDDLLDAFKSRVHVLHYAPPDAQMGALMLDIASRGWSADGEVVTVTPGEAVRVTEYVLGEALRLGCRLDLRLLTNKAFPDYQQWKDGESESDWRDLVTASIEQHLFAPRHGEEGGPIDRQARLEEERRIAREVAREHKTREGRVKAWAERTGGKSERAFYRRLAESQ